MIVTPVHMARFRTFRLRNSLIALKSGRKRIHQWEGENQGKDRIEVQTVPFLLI